MNTTASPIQNLISLCRENNRTGHTRTCEQMFGKAEAEHAVLVAVAEQCKHAESDIQCLMRMLARHADISCKGGNLDFSLKKIQSALSNLAAVREGKAQQ